MLDVRLFLVCCVWLLFVVCCLVCVVECWVASVECCLVCLLLVVGSYLFVVLRSYLSIVCGLVVVAFACCFVVVCCLLLFLGSWLLFVLCCCSRVCVYFFKVCLLFDGCRLLLMWMFYFGFLLLC